MAEQANPPSAILRKMLDRLYATLVSGPSLNCRPHSSRQRIDLTQFASLNDITPEAILRQLLAADASSKVVARVPAPRGATANERGLRPGLAIVICSPRTGPAVMRVPVGPGSGLEAGDFHVGEAKEASQA
jgi:hypothetical protein